MVFMVILVAASLPFINTDAFKVKLPSHLFNIQTGDGFKTKSVDTAESVKNLTETMKYVDMRLSSLSDEFQKVASTFKAHLEKTEKQQKEHTDKAKSTDEKLTGLEAQLSQTKSTDERLTGLEEQLSQAKSTDERLTGLEEQLSQVKSAVKDIENELLCPRGFNLNRHPKVCFILITENVDATTEFDKRCSQLMKGGRLIQMQNRDTLSAVKTHLIGVSLTQIIVGVQSAESGRFEWHDGTPIDGSLFCPGEPNNTGNLLNFYPGSGTRCLDDSRNGYGFICEIPL